MVIHTTRFGDLTLQEEQVINFANGVPGFKEATRYVTLDLQEYRPFLFMQSLDLPELTFILVDPYPYFSSYVNNERIAKEAGWNVEDKNRLLVRVIVTIHADGEMTVNLLAPVLINTKENKGEQVLLQGVQGLSTRHSIGQMQTSQKREVAP